MKTFFAVFSLLMSAAALAGQTVLLTSLELKAKDQSKLERIFREETGEADVVIKHGVGPAELHRILHSPQTEKLFWISHAATERSVSAGIEAANIIMDIHGNDVKKFFSSAGPHLKYLAIIGCQAQQIIDGFRARGNYDDRPDLKIFSFSKKVLLFKGLKEAIEEGKDISAPPYLSAQIDPLEFDIKAQGLAPESWLELGDQVLGVFDSSTNRIKTNFPLSLWTAMPTANIKFFKSKEANVSSLPELTIKVNGHTDLWKPFASADGKALGNNDKRLYLYEKR